MKLKLIDFLEIVFVDVCVRIISIVCWKQSIIQYLIVNRWNTILSVYNFLFYLINSKTISFISFESFYTKTNQIHHTSSIFLKVNNSKASDLEHISQIIDIQILIENAPVCLATWISFNRVLPLFSFEILQSFYFIFPKYPKDWETFHILFRSIDLYFRLNETYLDCLSNIFIHLFFDAFNYFKSTEVPL
jgi:hypothetical protein